MELHADLWSVLIIAIAIVIAIVVVCLVVAFAITDEGRTRGLVAVISASVPLLIAWRRRR